MTDERLEDLLDRLERERGEADDLYHAALTALDRSLQRVPDMPHAPPAYDARQLASINLSWDTLPAGAPAIDGSFKGRLRGFVWRLVGPSLEKQKAFNAALVDHLNRNVAAHEEAEKAIATLIALVRQHVDGLTRFQSLLVQYLQTITLYVDTKDRSTAGQVQVVNAGLSALTGDWLKRWESLTTREQRFTARVSAMDDLRASVGLAQQTALSLKREVERLLTAGVPAQASGAEPSTSGLDAFKYVGFEDAFRGSPDEIRTRLAEYVPKFEGLADVLDIGCGRGEFLELLRAHGISARGLDLNHEMVEVSRARGLNVVEADALSYVSALPDASLGGILAAQVVEHLDPAYLMRLIEAAFHKVRPGGRIVLETINPTCWLAFFESYIRDLTHVRPLHPDTLQYLLRVSGFQNVEVEYRSPVADAARLELAGRGTDDSPVLAQLVDSFNENMTKLNARIFTYQDYSVTATR